MSDLDAPRAVLYVRGSSVGHEREAAVIEALEALAADGVLDGVEVRTWPEKVSFEGAGRVGREFVEAFETFDAWAEEHGVAVCPPFVVREQDSAILQEHDEVLVTPMLFLSLWDGPQLAGVYPCSHTDGVTTVEDCLASFRGKVAGERAAEPSGETRFERKTRFERTPTAGAGNGGGRDSDT